MNWAKPATASSRTTDKNVRVLRALKKATHGNAKMNNPLREQLKQCPEASKVGEILGKAFDSLKYAQDGSEIGERYLPPSGVVIPPLV